MPQPASRDDWVPGDPAGADLRRTMARFPTGVTVVTTRGEQGVRHAMTANSFTSVSLEPPLVLLSVARRARFHAPLTASGEWAVSILAADQQPLAEHFSRSGRDLATQFDEVATVAGPVTGLPLLPGALGWLECRTAELVPAGDHTLVLGEVCDARPNPALLDREPLFYHGSHYR